MLAHAPIIAFVPVRDVAQARRFYVDTLGLPVVDESPFALVVDAAGTMLRLTPVADLHPQPFTIVGWSVDDIGAYRGHPHWSRRDVHPLRRNGPGPVGNLAGTEW